MPTRNTCRATTVSFPKLELIHNQDTNYAYISPKAPSSPEGKPASAEIVRCTFSSSCRQSCCACLKVKILLRYHHNFSHNSCNVVAQLAPAAAHVHLDRRGHMQVHGTLHASPDECSRLGEHCLRHLENQLVMHLQQCHRTPIRFCDFEYSQEGCTALVVVTSVSTLLIEGWAAGAAAFHDNNGENHHFGASVVPI